MTSSETPLKPANTLRPGAELELDFTDILANGQGVGRAGGMVVFCFGPLPGERARIRVTAVKPNYSVGELLELLDESPKRTQPFCPVFGTCGGCQLQHFSYPAQLAWKREVVRNALIRIGGLEDPVVNETIGMTEPRGYRNKMSLVVDDRRKPAAIGFYRQRSHAIVPIDSCPVVTPPLNAILERLTAERIGGAIAGMLRGARHLVARSANATGRSVLTVTSERRSETLPRVAALAMRALPGLAGIENSFELSSVNAIVGRRHRLVAGLPRVDEVVGGVRYRVSPSSFFQINVTMLARIFEFLKSRLEPAGSLVDLYCGAGTFALYFAKHGWHVFGLEENPHAIAEAVANAKLNALQERARFEAGQVEAITEGSRAANAMLQADALFVDPPRKGCEPAALERIAGARVRRIFYLSCDSATLARDLKFLLSKGYRLGVVQPFDMFPQTGHIETLVELEYSELAIRHD